MPKYSEVERTVGELRELADFLEEHGVALPDYWVSTTLHINLTSTEGSYNDEGEWESKLDEEGTKDKIRKFLLAVGSCEKDYRDDRLTISKKYSNGLGRNMVTGTADRSIACKKVVTGKKFVKEHLVPSKFEEEYEWKCDENISLLKLVQ